MIEALAGGLGAGDCERLVSGELIQPVNAWSSLAYSVVGIALMVSMRRASGPERAYGIVFGFLLVFTGVGSFVYHGPQQWGAGFLHDITFLSALWFLIIVDAGTVLGRRPGRIWFAAVVAVAVLAGVLLAAPGSTNVLTGGTVVVLVLSDLALRRVGSYDRRWYAAALVLFAAALIANGLGRTGSALCAPGSWFQLHALWHVLSAGALGAYFLATGSARVQEFGT